MWVRSPIVLWLLAIVFAVLEVSWAASFSIHEAQLTTGRPSGQGSVDFAVYTAWIRSVRSLLGTTDDQSLLGCVTERIGLRTWTSADEAHDLLGELVSALHPASSRA